MRRIAPAVLLVSLVASAAGSLGLGWTADAPEISRSRGAAGSVIVLWPRVVPADPKLDGLALEIENALAEIATSTGVTPNVRPSPQRACPSTGCKATALSAVIVHEANGCAVVATVAAPGKTETRLVPAAGKVVALTPTVAFRQPPEAQVKVVDFVPCTGLAGLLDTAAIKSAIEAAR